MGKLTSEVPLVNPVRLLDFGAQDPKGELKTVGDVVHSALAMKVIFSSS